MTKETKDTMTVISACAMLLFGATLTAIGFSVEPMGEVHDSVLWILGQCFVYAGSIFGVTYYTRSTIDRKIDDWKREMRNVKEQDDEQAEENG